MQKAAGSDAVLESRSRSEPDSLRGLDLDGFVGLRVASGASGTLGHLEGAEADQGDLVATLKAARVQEAEALIAAGSAEWDNIAVAVSSLAIAPNTRLV